MKTNDLLQIEEVKTSDPRIDAMFTVLLQEYQDRYAAFLGDQTEDFERHPNQDYEPPAGLLLILTLGEVTVAGGAFRRYDLETAEIKKMWTHEDYRRRGLAKKILSELEDRAQNLGYRRILLTTGPLQPEAQALYFNSGYRPHFDPTETYSADTSLLYSKELTHPDL